MEVSRPHRKPASWQIATAALIVLAGAIATATAPAGAAAPTVKDMTFFLHYVNDSMEPAKTLPGAGSTWSYFDTSAAFNTTNTTFAANGSQQIFNWYLAPALAGPVNITGYSFAIWAGFLSGNPNAQTTLDLVERNDTGGENLVESANFGSVPFTVSPSLKQLNWTLAAAHTFAAGSSIKLSLKVNPGSGSMVFIFDTARADSRVAFVTQDAVAVSSIEVQDSAGVSVSSLDPQAANRTARIHATVSDPYGGYDIVRANVTVLSPTGAALVDNASMTMTAGTPISLDTEFDFAWNYSGMPPGEYQAVVYVMDNNGVNWYEHFAQFTYGPYGDLLARSFFIGSLPLHAWVKVVDDHQVALQGASLSLLDAGTPVAAGSTDATGMDNLTAFAGNYTLVVKWAGVQVASQAVSLTANVTAAAPWLVNASVYYPTLHVVDSRSLGVEHAFVYLAYPNGTSTIVPFRTDDAGSVALLQVTGGPLGVRVLWRGVEVAAATVAVNASATIPIPASVFYLTVLVNDGAGAPLELALVRMDDAVFGLISEANVTGASGSFTERLPAGAFDLDATWRGVEVGTLAGTVLNADKSVTLSARVFTLTVKAHKGDGSPLAGATVTVTTAAGAVYEVETTGADGSAAVRTPGGTYSVSAHFATTTYWSPVEQTVVQANITVDQSKTVELKFDEVPGSFVGSNMFLAVLLVVVLAALLFLTMRGKAKLKHQMKAGESKGAGAEAKPGETQQSPKL